MDLQRVRDYPGTVSSFSRDVPAEFNFATDVVEVWAQDPNRLALICVNEAGEEQKHTYAQIAEAARRIGHTLTTGGVNAGDRVIVMLPRIAEWQISMVACLRIGAVPIPCITMLTASDLAYRCRDASAVAVITTEGETHKFDALEDLSLRIAVGEPPAGWIRFDASSDRTTAGKAARVAREQPAILYYTSGSTGNPKAVSHSSGALYAWRTSAEFWLSLDDGDVIWCTADTGWSKAGTSILFGPWSRGAAVLFYDGPFDAVRRFELIERYRVVCFCAAATELRRLVAEDVSAFDLSSLQLAVSAGESVNPEIIERWTSLVGTPLLDGYGQTETLMTIANMPGVEVRPGSMGRPLPGVEAGVLTEAGTVDGHNAAGQLVIKAPNPQLMLGYRLNEQRTADSYIDVDGSSWFLTGDNVEIDADGYFFYTGRVDDIIGSAGYRIGPQEVENALIKHPAVRECAVVGAPDAERGQIVMAYVVLVPGTTGSDDLVRELQQHTKTTTAPYKYPRRIEFVADLPTTVTGKIRRDVLRRMSEQYGSVPP
jgi:acyl-coenzyme A synthetase/AMP-(fatty) acid ligase